MGNVVHQLASHLRDRGHRITVYTPQYPQQETVAQQQEHVRRLTPRVSFSKSAYMPALKKELDEADLVHLHYPFFGTANMVRKWKQRNPDKSLVITYHMDTRGTGWQGAFFKIYNTFWMPKILRSADACIASSEDFLAHSQAATLYQEQKQRWSVIPFGVDTDRFVPRQKPKHLFEQYRLDPDQATVVFVGGMDQTHHFKGVSVLLRALARLSRAGKPVQAVLVGGGELREQFMLQAQGMGLGRTVQFAGFVDDDALPHHYAMGDALVLPSTTQGEAFGMVLLEAMASGLPVIASDLPGVRTVAQAAGTVVPPNDPDSLAEAIEGFFFSDIDRREWAICARSVAKHEYSWSAIAAAHDALYQRL